MDMPPLMSRRDTEETELALIKRGFEDGNEAGGEERRQEKRAPREAAEEIRKWFRNVEGSNKGDAKVVGNVDLMHVSSCKATKFTPKDRCDVFELLPDSYSYL